MQIKTLFLLLIAPALLKAQGYSSFFTGDTTDVSTDPVPGIVLAGGGGDSDEAMRWMLERADSGDVVVLRASGSDGYNAYFFEELGVYVNSVETIRFDNAAAANDPYVENQIRNAECLFFAGGDQYDYLSYWQGTPVQEAINYLINEKGVTVGGTSAGMAILSNWYYAPSGSSLTTEEALSDPFHPDYEVLGQNDFLELPFLDNTVTDTHYEQRERPGRHVGFLARIAAATQSQSFGIAANEYTAACIDENGLARAFGEYPEFQEDIVFFLQANCQNEFLPEIMEAGTPLTWNRGQSAVKVYALPARLEGTGTVDLTDWQTVQGGEWQNWYVESGELIRIPETNGDCADVLTSTAELLYNSSLSVFPNPASGQLFWHWKGQGSTGQLTLRTITGQPVKHWSNAPSTLDIAGLPAGVYTLEAIIEGQLAIARVIIE
ncbi:MAG: Type 1 glutamine amidotransferase-like domain-containing protein [Phaeodactylibacter sp.]|uniref:Type 1 glutamine amidotransferase-like domain-containing protein n=1 Tax=Phaeodactylibacter sp. TaxID=1940289 RepID=UPI0032EBFF8C